MNEKRFELDGTGIFDNKTNRFFYKTFDNEEVVDLLNELNKEFEDCEKLLESKDDFIHKFKRDIEELGISIKLFEDDIATKDKKIDEQQSTINELQSIINHIKCEENCFDYDYCCETVCSFYKEIKHLKEENEQLKKAIRNKDRV